MSHHVSIDCMIPFKEKVVNGRDVIVTEKSNLEID